MSINPTAGLRVDSPARPTTARGRAPLASVLLAATSVAASLTLAVAMDAVLILSDAPPAEIAVSVLLFNATTILQSAVGALVELRRPGQVVARLMLLSGPLYGLVATGWVGADRVAGIVDPGLFQLLNWAGLLLSFPVVALIAGWIPLLFPTGRLPGPAWRIPVATLILLSGLGLAAYAVRPGPMAEGVPLESPFAIEPWPPILQLLVDALWLELVALFGMAVVALAVRYRRGDPIERLQIRWLAAAAGLAAVGFAAVFAEGALRTDDGPLLSAMVAYAGILLMPVAVGIALLRYRLYEIDRIISRTVGWAAVSGMLVAAFGALVIGLQAVLAGLTQGQTVAVAISTLTVAAAFQPVRRRVQAAIDRRFFRSSYDAGLATTRLAIRLRSEVDLGTIRRELASTVSETIRPVSVTSWIRGSGS